MRKLLTLLALLPIMAHAQVIHSFQQWGDGGSFGKRIILPHDSVDRRSDVLYINGQLYIRHAGADSSYYAAGTGSGGTGNYLPLDFSQPQTITGHNNYIYFQQAYPYIYDPTSGARSLILPNAIQSVDSTHQTGISIQPLGYGSAQGYSIREVTAGDNRHGIIVGLDTIRMFTDSPDSVWISSSGQVGVPGMQSSGDTNTVKPVGIKNGILTRLPSWPGGGGGSGIAGVKTDNSLLGDGALNPLKIDSAILNNHEGIDTLGYGVGLDTLGQILYDTLYAQNGPFPSSFYVASGSVSMSFSGNNIALSNTTNNDYNSRLGYIINGLGYPGYLPNWNRYLTVQLTSAPSGTTYGIGVGRSNGFIGWIDLTTGANAGKITLTTVSGIDLTTSATGITFAQNDIFKLNVWYQNDSAYFGVLDVTNGQYKQVSYAYDFSPAAYTADKIGIHNIYQKGGAYLLLSDRLASNIPINAPLVLLGDSKTEGYYQGAVDSTFGAKLNKRYTITVNFGSSGDQVQDVISRLGDVFLSRPKQVICEFGCNNVRAGQPVSTWGPIYKTIVDSLEKAGIKAYHICPWESQTDLTVLDSFLTATYPKRYIRSAFTQIQACGAACLVTDGIHPNSRGADSIFKSIVRDGRVMRNNYRQSVNFLDATKVGNNINPSASLLVNDRGNVKKSTPQAIGVVGLKSNTFPATAVSGIPLLGSNGGNIETTTPDQEGLLSNGGNSFGSFVYGSKNGAPLQQLNNSRVSMTWEGYPLFARWYRLAGNVVGVLRQDSLGNFEMGGTNTNTLTGGNNTYINGTGGNLTSGNRNVLISQASGNGISTGNDNVRVGYLAGYNDNSDSSTFFGTGVMAGGGTNCSGCTISGAWAALNNKTGNHHNIFGQNSGKSITNATHVSIFGDNIDAVSPNANYQFNVLNVMRGIWSGSGVGGTDTIFAKTWFSDAVGFLHIPNKVSLLTTDSLLAKDISGNTYAIPASALSSTPTTPTLQQVFNSESGGRSVLAKADTIDGNGNDLLLTGLRSLTVNSSLPLVLNIGLKVNSIIQLADADYTLGSNGYTLFPFVPLTAQRTITPTSATTDAGRIFVLITPSSGTYTFSFPAATVYDAAGNAITTTDKGSIYTIQAIQGKWTIISKSTSALGGIGINRVTTISANTTLDNTYHVVRVNASSGSVTVTLPAASSYWNGNGGIEYIFIRIDNTPANTVTIQRSGSDLINGASSFTISNQYTSKTVQNSSSTTWDQY